VPMGYTNLTFSMLIVIFQVILGNVFIEKDTRTIVELPGMTMKPIIRIYRQWYDLN
jgi:hypothetical protein